MILRVMMRVMIISRKMMWIMMILREMKRVMMISIMSTVPVSALPNLTVEVVVAMFT